MGREASNTAGPEAKEAVFMRELGWPIIIMSMLLLGGVFLFRHYSLGDFVMYSNNPKLVEELVAHAMAGVKIVATIHATEGVVRIRNLLRQYGAGELLLDRLIADGRVVVVQQELVWPNAAMREQAEQARRSEWDRTVRTVLTHDPKLVIMPNKPKP